MEIYGLQKLSLLDYPEHTACTVFTAGCNLRCPFCHNAALVLEPDPGKALGMDEFWDFLHKRRGLLDAVCISGGEPLLQADLPEFIQEIKKLGYLVKVDTNGLLSARLLHLLEERSVDYIAMDIKNAARRYALTCGVPAVDLAALRQSITALIQGGTPYEFRTTLCRPFHDVSVMEDMGRMLEGAGQIFLQKFVDSGELIGRECSPLSPEETEHCAAVLRRFIAQVHLRG